MDPKRELLFNVEWQVLRVSLLNTWANEKTEDSVMKLLAYVGKAETPEERLVRIWRCTNLLRAVPLGEPKSASRRTIVRARTTFERRLNAIEVTTKYPKHDWGETRRALVVLYRTNPEVWKKLRANLEARMKKVGMNSQVGYMQQKPESAKFIRLMRDVQFEEETANMPSAR